MGIKLVTILALSAAVAAPAMAQDGARRRRPENSASQEQQTTRAPERAQRRERAAPAAPPQVRRDSDRIENDNRVYSNSRYDNNRRYDYNRAVPRRYPPRVVRPVVVRVVPSYRPYVYRPSYRAGVIYGTNGYYPYGYTPRGYYNPIPGRPYGGLRITDAPRYARVFADGYFVGLVNDFDGIFQHLNLEAGPHRIEIEDDGFGAIAFDVFIRPGETVTYRGRF